MVTASQLVIPHSFIASLVPMVSNVHVKLDDTNYLQWHFQMNLLLKCHGTLGFVTGSHPCPPQFVVGSNSEVIEAYKVWQLHDKALMLLISTTLSASAISCVIGSTNAKEMWLTLKERMQEISYPVLACTLLMKTLSSWLSMVLFILTNTRYELQMSSSKEVLSAEKTQAGAAPSSSAQVKHLVGMESKKIGGIPCKEVCSRIDSPAEKQRDVGIPPLCLSCLHQSRHED
ncbi:unnamed protein product [Prunus armeniaca]